MTRTGARIALPLVVLGTIGCDRVTKRAATEWLAGEPARSFLAGSVRLVYAENRGGFLSLGATLAPAARTALFTTATGLFLAGLLLVALRARWSLGRSIGVALLLGGGISNWIDRLLHGRVVDFLNVGLGPLRTGIFNLADVAILAGLGVMLLYRAERPKILADSNPTPDLRV